MAQLNAIAVFEALAHRRASTHAYVLVEHRNVLATAYEKRLSALKQAASDHGVGVIVFDDPADYETWDEVVVAQRSETVPELLNDFIETQVSQPGQQAIEHAIEKSRAWLVELALRGGGSCSVSHCRPFLRISPLRAVNGACYADRRLSSIW